MSGRLARYDQDLAHRFGAGLLAGVDEVGRGCLAGPVVVAAVVLPLGILLEGVDDSKRLTAAARVHARRRIREAALAYAVVAVPAEEVDRRNVLAASLLGMSRAVESLGLTPDLVLVDGPHLPAGCAGQARAIVGGDGRSQSIAAASILAKVARDRLMRLWHLRYPDYGFHSNVGYPTPAHLQALRERGPCPLHRRSFAPVRACAEQTALAL